MKPLFFHQVTIVDSGGPHDQKTVDLLVENGAITHLSTKFRPDQIPEHAERLEGGCLSIGWTDLRSHLSDPGFEYKEDLESLATAARRGGFTQIVCLPNTEPVIDNSGLVRSQVARAKELPVRILPTGTLSKGAKGEDLAELYDMHQAGAVAFTDGIRPVGTTGLLLRGLQYLKTFDGLLIDFPLDSSLVQQGDVAEGISATRMGLKGIPTMAETLAVDRALQVLDYFEGRLHLGPITAAGSLDRIASAKSRHSGLTVETSALYLLMSEEDTEGFEPETKLWPPLRGKADRKALCEAIRSGTIDAISSSHHPQSTEEKKHDFKAAHAGASTIELAFSAAWTGYDRFGGPLSDIVHCLSAGPRTVLGQAAPFIEVGKTVDLTWFDPDQEWTPTAMDLYSKSKYSPLLGKALKGRVLGSLYGLDWQVN